MQTLENTSTQMYKSKKKKNESTKMHNLTSTTYQNIELPKYQNTKYQYIEEPGYAGLFDAIPAQDEERKAHIYAVRTRIKAMASSYYDTCLHSTRPTW